MSVSGLSRPCHGWRRGSYKLQKLDSSCDHFGSRDSQTRTSHHCQCPGHQTRSSTTVGKNLDDAGRLRCHSCSHGLSLLSTLCSDSTESHQWESLTWDHLYCHALHLINVQYCSEQSSHVNIPSVTKSRCSHRKATHSRERKEFKWRILDFIQLCGLTNLLPSKNVLDLVLVWVKN